LIFASVGTMLWRKLYYITMDVAIIIHKYLFYSILFYCSG